VTVDERLVSPDYYQQLVDAGSVARNPKGPDRPYDPSEPNERKKAPSRRLISLHRSVLFALHGGARGKGEISTSTNHLGFRCVKDPLPRVSQESAVVRPVDAKGDLSFVTIFVERPGIELANLSGHLGDKIGPGAPVGLLRVVSMLTRAHQALSELFRHIWPWESNIAALFRSCFNPAGGTISSAWPQTRQM
jgi:hypothetical protein